MRDTGPPSSDMSVTVVVRNGCRFKFGLFPTYGSRRVDCPHKSHLTCYINEQPEGEQLEEPEFIDPVVSTTAAYSILYNILDRT